MWAVLHTWEFSEAGLTASPWWTIWSGSSHLRVLLRGGPTPAHRVRNLARTGLRLRLAKLPQPPRRLQLTEGGEAGLWRSERDGGACGDVRPLSREGRTARRNSESEYSM